MSDDQPLPLPLRSLSSPYSAHTDAHPTVLPRDPIDAVVKLMFPEAPRTSRRLDPRPPSPVVERLEVSFDQLLSCAIEREDDDLCQDIPHSDPDNDFDFKDSETCTTYVGLAPPMTRARRGAGQ
ncbi:hypothetical protein DXG01_013819, partial [Tephrocybe rancida]